MVGIPPRAEHATDAIMVRWPNIYFHCFHSLLRLIEQEVGVVPFTPEKQAMKVYDGVLCQGKISCSSLDLAMVASFTDRQLVRAVPR